jgi:hypothetical protein
MVAVTSGDAPAARVASTRHTVFLLLALLAVSVQAAMGRAMEEWPRTLSAPGDRLRLYLEILTLQWAWAGSSGSA